MSMPGLDPDLLKAFVVVAEQQSFTRAATMLNRTQSAVSMQIKRLEERLDVQLFHRTTIKVDLSTAGEELLGYARRILTLNDEAVGRLREHKVEGVVRLGVMEDYGAYIIPPLLTSFVAGYPMIHIEMETGLTCSMPERLGDTFDLVIAMHPEGKGEGQFLRREQAVWAAGPDRSSVELNPLPVALYPQGCLFRKWAMEALDSVKRPWRLAFVSQSQAAVESIVAQGLAVTVVKSGMFPKRLRRLTIEDDMPDLPGADICLHRAANISPAAMLLADHFVEALATADSNV
ncbi:LysR family transcriptional regulator [Phyllobacterium sp. YR531]|uniref:LysR family transcriptional regulator n=1 Tax=Phyllobacterium sp. YR531 TaxID=1144343 RepID=UPI00026F4910|nr:LysR family transcriptional regulator [Phyllobacterium sp. YR531]EJN05553.1 transcriptional regulator [Phyllobacterium sp. YR531]